MRQLARACLPDTFTALPKGKPPVISDGCPWQRLKQIHQSKEKEEEGQRAVFVSGEDLGILNLSARQAQIPSHSCLAGASRTMFSSLAKSWKEEEGRWSPGHWGSLPGACSPPQLALAPLSSCSDAALLRVGGIRLCPVGQSTHS